MPWKPASIPIVSPIAVLKANENGRTQPLEMRCETGHSSKDYIVKLWNGIESNSHSLAKEIYGSLLAEYFELRTPPIALVDIPPDFAESILDPKHRERIKASPGLNFGSQYISGSIIFKPPVTSFQVSLAARVFCFDMLICNLDRCKPKINMFNNLTLIDHEQAFIYSRPYMILGGFSTISSFIIKETWPKSHILYSDLKGDSLLPEIEKFVSDLVRLKDNILVKIEEQIPAEWQKDVNKITAQLANTRDNADLFKRNLQELLA